jgi:hypothetical protein
VRRVLLMVLVALGTPRRHGCWTEPMLERHHLRGSVPKSSLTTKAAPKILGK